MLYYSSKTAALKLINSTFGSVNYLKFNSIITQKWSFSFGFYDNKQNSSICAAINTAEQSCIGPYSQDVMKTIYCEQTMQKEQLVQETITRVSIWKSGNPLIFSEPLSLMKTIDKQEYSYTCLHCTHRCASLICVSSYPYIV